MMMLMMISACDDWLDVRAVIAGNSCVAAACGSWFVILIAELWCEKSTWSFSLKENVVVLIIPVQEIKIFDQNI